MTFQFDQKHLGAQRYEHGRDRQIRLNGFCTKGKLAFTQIINYIISIQCNTIQYTIQYNTI